MGVWEIQAKTTGLKFPTGQSVRNRAQFAQLLRKSVLCSTCFARFAPSRHLREAKVVSRVGVFG